MKTPIARFAFTDTLWTPQKRDNGTLQYGCSLLFPKGTDLIGTDEDGKPVNLKEMAVKAAVDEWGDKAKQMIADGIIKNPFLDGDGKQGKNKQTGEAHAGFPGTTFIRVISGGDYAPKLFNKKARPATKDELYSGCYGFAVINAFTWENRENGKGISFGISFAQVTKDGERLGGGGGINPDKWAEKIEDEGEAPASTKDGAGAGGLFG
jgi:hypothetical protein